MDHSYSACDAIRAFLWAFKVEDEGNSAELVVAEEAVLEELTVALLLTELLRFRSSLGPPTFNVFVGWVVVEVEIVLAAVESSS